jgi:hypothetical protein
MMMPVHVGVEPDRISIHRNLAHQAGFLKFL